VMSNDASIRRTTLRKELQHLQDRERRLRELLASCDNAEIRTQAESDLKRTVEQISSVSAELQEP
jgi:hypothetical protein